MSIKTAGNIRIKVLGPEDAVLRVNVTKEDAVCFPSCPDYSAGVSVTVLQPLKWRLKARLSG